MKKFGLILLIILILSVLCSCSGGNIQNESTEKETQITTGYETSKMKETNTTKKTANSITVKVGGKSFPAQLYDNETAQAFSDMLPLTLDMQELHGNEKYYYMSESLPTNSSAVKKINSGDIMLYGDDCVVLFYDNFLTPYSYTKIGKIDNPAELVEAVGSGDVTVEFQLND